MLLKLQISVFTVLLFYFFFFFNVSLRGAVSESEAPADVVVVARLVRGLVALGPRRRVRRRRRPDAQRRAGRHKLRHDRVQVHVAQRHTPAAAHDADHVEILSRGQQQQPTDQPVIVQRLGK